MHQSNPNPRQPKQSVPSTVLVTHGRTKANPIQAMRIPCPKAKRLRRSTALLNCDAYYLVQHETEAIIPAELVQTDLGRDEPASGALKPAVKYEQRFWYLRPIICGIFGWLFCIYACYFDQFSWLIVRKMSLLFYRRPEYVAKNHGRMDASDFQKYLEKQRAAIPQQLCFENVVTNRAMPPCSLQDFMGYLLYVSHEAESLQFYLWFQDYSKRFFTASRAEQALSPPWDEDKAPEAGEGRVPNSTTHRKSEFQFDFDAKDPLPLSPTFGKHSFISTSANNNFARPMDFANAQAGLKWQSFTIQPFRSEVNRIISHYLAPGSPRELNLSQRDRTACLHALQHTTHPSAFSIPIGIVTDSLRNQSHPNFIRWSMVNGNKPRIIFGRTLGILHILFGFVIAILLTLSVKPRWWRFFAALAWFLGFNFLLAGSNGICLVLYATRNRHLRPWEQVVTDSASSYLASDESDQTTLAGSDVYSMSHGSGKKRHVALEAFGTANSYGHELWVEKYRAKMMIRKIFDTSVWVQNENIRIMQDKVALQGLVLSIIATVPLTALFTAVPRGGFY